MLRSLQLCLHLTYENVNKLDHEFDLLADYERLASN